MPSLESMSSPRVSVTTLMTIALVVALGTVLPRTEAARAFFVFGDSLVDSGNNNYLATTARADSPPYGIDYPTHRPTGRFSNGLNLPDIISEQIGTERILPYLSPELTGQKLLVGANFASAGIGILNDTGIQFVNIIRMSRQFELFQQYQQRVTSQIGAAQAKRLVNDALVLMTLGGNDFVNNYFLIPFSARSRQFSIQAYSRYLISEYRKILMRLYELGARRVMVTGTGPLGCVPAELAMRSRNGECVPELQRAAGIFNPELVQMIQQLNSELGADVFVSANAFQMNMNFINNPQRFGFVTSKVACCGQGPYNGLGQCNRLSNLCPNRNVYAFWDSFQASADSEKSSPRFLGYFLFGSSHQSQSLEKNYSFKEQSAHVASVKNILENHASYLMSGKELSKLVAFVKGTQFDLVEYLQRERYGSARLENFASGLELIGQKLQMGTLQSRLDAEFLLAHMCSVKFKEWIVVLATLLRRAEVLFDLFRHDMRLWKAYSITLQSHPTFAEFGDLLEDLEDKLSSVANLDLK